MEGEALRYSGFFYSIFMRFQKYMRCCVPNICDPAQKIYAMSQTLQFCACVTNYTLCNPDVILEVDRYQLLT
jgi:hypothetical protein